MSNLPSRISASSRPSKRFVAAISTNPLIERYCSMALIQALVVLLNSRPAPPKQAGSSAPAPAPWTALAPNGSRLFWFSDRGKWLGRFAACPNVPEVLYIIKNYLDDVLGTPPRTV